MSLHDKRTVSDKTCVLEKYHRLDQGTCVQALYIWIDGTGEGIRCKTKTLDKKPVSIDELPIWNFDGSSTAQAKGHNSDVYLHPVAIFKDPFRGGENILVLCETYTHDHKGTNTNKRKTCVNLMNDPEVKVIFMSLEREYLGREWQGHAFHHLLQKWPPKTRLFYVSKY